MSYRKTKSNTLSLKKTFSISFILKKEHFEAACEITDDAEITPFAYRAHAHKLGLVNSGYLIKTNPVSLEQEWIELGRRSPQLPQMFYPVTNSIKINKGDILAARCTMYNFRDHSVHIGYFFNNHLLLNIIKKLFFLI